MEEITGQQRFNEHDEPDEDGKFIKVNKKLVRIICAAIGCENKVTRGGCYAPACAHIIQLKQASDLYDVEYG